MSKTNYDHGNCDRITSLNETSTIETVPPTCNEYTFIPNTTIKQLSENTDRYRVGKMRPCSYCFSEINHNLKRY